MWLNEFFVFSVIMVVGAIIAFYGEGRFFQGWNEGFESIYTPTRKLIDELFALLDDMTKSKPKKGKKS